MTVLRLQNGPNCALANGVDWFKSAAYTTNEIVTIPDPDGGKGSEPTSIPSPFARIDVVRTALKYVNDGAAEDSTFSKIVSDCLDIAEIFFLQNRYKTDISIIEWDKNAAIEKLISPNSLIEHQILGDTLKMYLEQDAASFNFNFCDKFYLLVYKHKIIGATSPATLFFTTANDLSWVDITFPNGDKAFDLHVCPLYKRSDDFQIMLYSMRKYSPDFIRYFRDLNQYMDICLERLNAIHPALYSKIHSLTGNEYNSTNYDVIGNGIVLLNSLPLFGAKLIFADPISDFEIASTKYAGLKKPLVLLKGHRGLTTGGRPMRYFSASYIENTPVGYSDNENDLDKRQLPGLTGIIYPYLTINDFLEPNLIRTVYPINKNKFFDGNYTKGLFKENKGFLLPLKNLFFTFFNVEDLLKPLPNGKNMLEIESLATGTSIVTLHIPIRNGEYIVYKREYKIPIEGFAYIQDNLRNDGKILEHQFGVTLYPFLKTNDDQLNNFYRIQLVDRDIVGELKFSDYQLSFFKDTSPTIEVPCKTKVRSDKNVHAASSKYFILNDAFDFINVKSGSASGIIVPKWPLRQNGNKEFKFSVDFGTTYTHIEFCDNTDATPKPFDITKDNEEQIAHLFDNANTSEDFSGSGAIAIQEMINEEFLPLKIGTINSEFRFPQRTVLAESGRLDINSETDTLADFNIPFIFEKKTFTYNNTFQTNLKWAKQEPGNYKRIKSYLENLIFLIRNKVLLNNGNLEATKIIWFYPTSMKSGRKADLEQLWTKLVAQYFKPITAPIGIAESLAPFYFYKYKDSIPGGNSTAALSIDIGGGTTDIVVFLKNKPLLLSSFRFAANTLFGDGFSPIGNISKGMVKKYLPHFESILPQSGFQGQLRSVLDSLKKYKSEDINTFFFSLESNCNVTDKDLFSYNLLLSNDEDLKIIFLYFYSAIIYHTAQLMKNNNLDMPNHIFFSGTGSKILNIITSKFENLANLTTLIIENVYSEKYVLAGVKLITDMKNPKESTCKGGLMSNAVDLSLDIKNIKSVMTCLEDEGIDKLTYNEVDEKKKRKIVVEIERFNQLFLSIIDQSVYLDDFKISNVSFMVFKRMCNLFLKEYLDDGIDFKKQLDSDIEGNKNLEETLFFLPLVGSINDMVNELSLISPVNN